MKRTNPSGRSAFLWSCTAIIAMQLAVSAATLVHRYDFTDDGTGTNIVDSVGGTNWYGTLPNGGDLATTTNQLMLTGGSQQYVQFPQGIISNYTAITVDMWATLGTLPGACFLWTFGNTDPATGNGGNCIFLQPVNARLCISGTQPTWGGEQNAGNFASLSERTVHVTCVIDPPNNRLAAYTNGVLAAENLTMNTPLTAVYCLSNYIGKSLFTADAYIDAFINEYRIWNGALSPLDIAGCDAAGPDVLGSATNLGTVTSIMMSVPYYQIVQGGHETPSVMASFSLFSGQVDVRSLSTFSSGNTNIFTVDTNGLITAVGQGSTSITAYYGGLSNSVTITAVPPASALTHRYSFNGDATDSVGGSAWDGTLPSGGDFTTVPGQVLISSNSSQYVQFPAGIITNYTSVTVDMWASLPTALPANCFLWAFGNTVGGGGGNCIFVQPLGGRLAISGGMPSWQAGEQNATGAGNLGGQTNFHLTAVVNPVAGWEALYVNGTLVGKNTAITAQMSQVYDVYNYIARSLYTGDSFIDVNVDEYRIFDGALSSQEIAIANQSGPNSVPNTVTNGPGSLTGFSIQVTNTLEVLTAASVKVLANYQYLTNFDLVVNSVLPVAGLTITSSDTNVMTYGIDGKVHGVKPGTAILTVTYQGVSSPKTITVTPATYTGVLVHRYSFNDAPGSTTVVDSIGGPAGDGSLPLGGTFGGGQLSMVASNTQYVLLPTNLFAGMTSVTLEAWTTFQPNLPGNCCFFSFGDSVSGTGSYYIFCAPAGGRVNIAGINPGWQGEQNAYSGINWSGRTLHITAVVNPPKNYIAIYTNGVLAGVNSSETYALTTIQDNFSYINRSLYNDPYNDLTINEFRIYNGALSPGDVAQTEMLGPDVLIGGPKLTATAAAGHNVILSWPTNAVGYTLMSRTNVSGGGIWNPVGTSPVISGANYQVTLPATNTAQFFQLKQ